MTGIKPGYIRHPINQGGDGTEVIPYIVQRAAVYFQAIANQVDKKLSSTKFVDCENFRKSCFAKDDNGGCGTSLKAALNNNRQSFIPDANRQNIFRFSQVNKKLYLDLTEDAPTSINYNKLNFTVWLKLPWFTFRK